MTTKYVLTHSDRDGLVLWNGRPIAYTIRGGWGMPPAGFGTDNEALHKAVSRAITSSTEKTLAGDLRRLITEYLE